MWTPVGLCGREERPLLRGSPTAWPKKTLIRGHSLTAGERRGQAHCSAGATEGAATLGEGPLPGVPAEVTSACSSSWKRAHRPTVSSRTRWGWALAAGLSSLQAWWVFVDPGGEEGEVERAVWGRDWAPAAAPSPSHWPTGAGTAVEGPALPRPARLPL